MLDLKYLSQHSWAPALPVGLDRCLQGLNQRREELKCHKMPVQGSLSLQPLKGSPAERSPLEPHPSGQSEVNTRESPQVP